MFIADNWPGRSWMLTFANPNSNEPCFDVPHPSIFAGSAATPQNFRTKPYPSSKAKQNDAWCFYNLMDDSPNGIYHT